MTQIKQNIPIQIGENGEISQGSTEFTSRLILGGTSNVTLNVNTDDLVVSGLEESTVLRVSCNGNRRLTGLVNPNTGKATVLFIVNVGSGDLLLRSNDNNSIAENRFIMGGNERLDPNEGGIFVYDVNDLRWRLVAIYQ